MVTRRLRTTIIFALMVITTGVVQAWGGYGHRVVGEIAETQLTPYAKAKVAELLEGESLADVSTWADTVRPDRPETAPLHYVNFPRDLSKPRQQDLLNAKGNVYTAIVGYSNLVIDESRPVPDRAEALKFVVHFAGDLHQPLHCGLAEDRGGNDVRVTMPDGSQSNLHRVWDSGILNSGVPMSEPDYASKLMNGAGADKLSELTREANVAAWIAESRAAAMTYAYDLPEGSSPRVSADYLQSNLPVVEERLLAAGVRLGALVNLLLNEGETPFEHGVPVFPGEAKPNFGPNTLYPQTGN